MLINWNCEVPIWLIKEKVHAWRVLQKFEKLFQLLPATVIDVVHIFCFRYLIVWGLRASTLGDVKVNYGVQSEGYSTVTEKAYFNLQN